MSAHPPSVRLREGSAQALERAARMFAATRSCNAVESPASWMLAGSVDQQVAQGLDAPAGRGGRLAEGRRTALVAPREMARRPCQREVQAGEVLHDPVMEVVGDGAAFGL